LKTTFKRNSNNNGNNIATPTSWLSQYCQRLMQQTILVLYSAPEQKKRQQDDVPNAEVVAVTIVANSGVALVDMHGVSWSLLRFRKYIEDSFE